MPLLLGCILVAPPVALLFFFLCAPVTTVFAVRSGAGAVGLGLGNGGGLGGPPTHMINPPKDCW